MSAARRDRADERRRRVLHEKTPSIVRSIADAVVIKSGDLFFLTQKDGQVPIKGHHGYGLYYHDCRYLRGYEISLGGQAPDVLASMIADGYRALVELSNPDLDLEGRILAKEHLALSWDRRVIENQRMLDDRLTVRNYAMEDRRVPLRLRFACGFEDVFTVRGAPPGRRGQLHPPEWRDGVLVWRYSGADDLERTLHVRLSPQPDWRGADEVSFVLALESGRSQTLRIALEVVEQPCQPVAAGPSVQLLDRLAQGTSQAAARWIQEHPQLDSDSILLNRIWTRNLQDLHTLHSEHDEDAYFAAGVPWYATLFGRDSLITAIQTLAYNPAIAEHTLRLLARHQGARHDPWRDEEPGKILHELRQGEMTRLNEVPYSPYYGSVDATPLFLILVGMHARWTGSLELFAELREPIERALAWIDRHPRYLSYQTGSKRGLDNQGWKDSGEAIVNADGSLARPPIALVEVQGYVYRAWRLLADLYRQSGDDQRAQALETAAAALRERFNRDFWSDELECLVLALQHGHRQARVVSSNAGQALWGGIADPERAARVVERLMRPDMFSGWGIRTLSAHERRFNPIGYHLGAVWPHDNSLIAAGFRRYGHDEAAYHLFDGMFDAATHFDQYRMPELFTGFGRQPIGEPVRYPVACHPQAWAAGSLPYLIRTMLGLQVEAMGRRLHLVRPMLPKMLHWLELRDLPVGRARVDLRFDRRTDRTRIEVIRREGPIEVVIDPPRDPPGWPRPEPRWPAT